jgi:hypothetical protein
MSDMIKKMLILVTIFFVLGITLAATRQVLTTAYFTVPTSVSFTLWFPGNISCVSGDPSATCTTELNFTSAADGNTKYANCSVVGGLDIQNESVPCMYIDNTGNVDLNISMYMNATVTNVVVFGAPNSTAATTPSTSSINASQYWVINQSLTPANPNITVWIWANFSSAAEGIVQRNFTIEGNTV